MKHITLSNGVEIPVIGFGTAAIGSWQQSDQYVTTKILEAIKLNYRHIDTASVYGTERNISNAIKDSGIPRSGFFISTKVWDTDQGYESTLRSFDESLNRLNTDYIDLFMIHWPLQEKTKETWQALEKLYDDKRVNAIGLSNFSI